MNKTISINIGGRNFFVEEPAFEKLYAYLSAIKAHFAEYPGSAEIISDMEARIAEKFIENSKGDTQTVITKQNVDNIIKELGTIEDLSEGNLEKNNNGNTQREELAGKRFYRNSDDKIIAGVCSGIAAYFDIDSTLVRLAFLILLFAWGTIIPIYIVLWIIIPEAKTPTEKMQMKGQSLNINSISQTIKEKALEAKDSTKKMKPFVSHMAAGLGKAAKILFGTIGRLAGLVVVIISILFLSGLTFVAASSIFNIHSPYLNPSFAILASSPAYYALVIAIYVAVFIPVLFLFLLGMAVLNKRKTVSSGLGLSLLGVWLATLIAGGVLAIQSVPDFVNKIHSAPDNQITTREFSGIGNFSNLDLAGMNNYKLVQGNTYSIRATGRMRDLDRALVESKNNTLTVGKKTTKKICLFCVSRKIDFEITAPEFSKITASGISNVFSDKIISTSTEISLSGASEGNVNMESKNITVQIDGVSRLSLTGTADSIKAELAGVSQLDASELAAKDANINASGASRAKVFATGSVTYQKNSSSNVSILGSPKINVMTTPSTETFPKRVQSFEQ